jgi:hypothetical protein
VKQPSKNGRAKSSAASSSETAAAPRLEDAPPERSDLVEAAPPKNTVAKVSHTLSLPLAERLESFAFFQRLSESSVIEFALKHFFGRSEDDAFLGDLLRRGGAGRRRRG